VISICVNVDLHSSLGFLFWLDLNTTHSYETNNNKKRKSSLFTCVLFKRIRHCLKKTNGNQYSCLYSTKKVREISNMRKFLRKMNTINLITAHPRQAEVKMQI